MPDISSYKKKAIIIKVADIIIALTVITIDSIGIHNVITMNNYETGIFSTNILIASASTIIIIESLLIILFWCNSSEMKSEYQCRPRDICVTVFFALIILAMLILSAITYQENSDYCKNDNLCAMTNILTVSYFVIYIIKCVLRYVFNQQVYAYNTNHKLGSTHNTKNNQFEMTQKKEKEKVKEENVYHFEIKYVYYTKINGEMFLKLEIDENKCSICQDKYKINDSDDIILTPCYHHYHKACIDKWFTITKICPLCEFDLSKCNV